jgi:hypothetical protein
MSPQRSPTSALLRLQTAERTRALDPAIAGRQGRRTGHVLFSQRLDRRIPEKQTLTDEVAAWERDRNLSTKADWQFTTENARIKLKHLNPLL